MDKQKTTKENKTSVSIRLQNETLKEIDRTAEEQGLTRTKVIEQRLKNKGNGITPAIMAQLQIVINTSLEGAKTGSPEKIKEAQKEANKLWQL